MLEERNLKDVLEQIQGVLFQEANRTVTLRLPARIPSNCSPRRPGEMGEGARQRRMVWPCVSHFLGVLALALENAEARSDLLMNGKGKEVQDAEVFCG